MIAGRSHRAVAPTVLLVMGVSGAGKTTIGERLARRLGWTFRDADTFHPASNIAKMQAGLPLTDDDRWPWLDAIGTWVDAQIVDGHRSVVTCSALRRAHRDRLRKGRPFIRLVFLQGSRALIADRLKRRSGHFMPPELLDSQFLALEEPRRDEGALVVSIALSPSSIVERVARSVAPPHQRPVRTDARPRRG